MCNVILEPLSEKQSRLDNSSTIITSNLKDQDVGTKVKVLQDYRYQKNFSNMFV